MLLPVILRLLLISRDGRGLPAGASVAAGNPRRHDSVRPDHDPRHQQVPERDAVDAKRGGAIQKVREQSLA